MILSEASQIYIYPLKLKINLVSSKTCQVYAKYIEDHWLLLFVGQRQTMHTQWAASDQGLHCLLTDCSIRTLIKMKNTT